MMDANQLMQMFGTIVAHAGQIAVRELDNFAECVKNKHDDADLCHAKTTIEDLGQCLLDAESNPLPPDQMQNRIMMATALVMVDSAALMHRVRCDSDFIRRIVVDSGAQANYWPVYATNSAS